MKTHQLSTVISTLALACGLSAAAFADEPTQTADVPEGLSLRQFAYAGTGCPAGSITGDLPVEGTTFVIGWQPFVAAVGPGVPLTESRKNCQILLDIAYPSGWQYAVQSLSYGGLVELEAGVTATVGAALYFQGSDVTTRFNQDTAGATAEDFKLVNDIAGEDQVWSTCDAAAARALNVNVQARLAATTRGGAGIVKFGESSQGAEASVLTLTWRRCD